MRRAFILFLTSAWLTGSAAAAFAQVSIVYQRRTKKTFLQVTVGYPQTQSPWFAPCHGQTRVMPILVPVAYPIGNPWRIEPQPTFASSSPTVPSTPPGLASKYSQYLPPAPLTKSPARGLAVKALFDRGLARLKAGDEAAALEAFRGALLRGPEDPVVETYFALTLAAAKDFVHADKAVRSALSQVSNAKDVLLDDPASRLADDEAWKTLVGGLEAEKSSAGKLALAFLRASSGEKPKARAILDKLLSTSPDDAVLKKLRAVVATD